MQILFNPQPAEQFGRIALGIPPLHLSELLLQLRRPQPVFVRKVLLGVDGVLGLHNLPQRLVPHQHGIQHGVFVEFEVVLFQHREPFAGPERDTAARRIDFAGEHAQKGRFPCAVGPDHTVTVTGRKLQIDVFEQDAFAKLDF